VVRAHLGGDRHPHRGALEGQGSDRKKLIALLDAQAGVEHEGDTTAPHADDDDRIALQAWAALHNGQGGMDWGGLPIVAAWLGVRDVDGLLQRLVLIKNHRPPES
jgi:hypothetical protein